MVKVTSVCSECTEVITEPLCVNCFEREVLAWVREQDFSLSTKRDIAKRCKELIAVTRYLSESDFTCVICRKNMRNVCNYCTMKEVIKTLKQHDKMEEAQLIFNPSLHHFGLQRS